MEMPAARNRTQARGIGKSVVDLRRLRYFLAVCDYGGFTKAAIAIGIAQPALTRQIKLLEKEVGQILIERTGRGARPSHQGRFLLARSRQHLEGLDGALRDLRQAFTAPRGSVTLGVCPSIAPFFLEDLIEHVERHHPNIVLSIIQAYSGDLKNLMEAGRIEIALTYRAPTAKNFASIDLLSERLVLVSGSAAPSRSGSCTLAELPGLKLILPSKIHALRGIIDRVCGCNNVAIEPDLELDSLDAVKASLIENTAGRYTILPYHSVLREVNRGELTCAEFAEPDMQRTIAAVRPRRPLNPEAVARLCDRLALRAIELKRILPTVF
jgi:LysR family nitrogen assimilation transcriptional regulator